MEIEDTTEYDKRVARVEELMEKEDFGAAALEAKKVVDELEPTLPAIAKASLFQAMSTMTKAMNEMAESGESPPLSLFEEVWKSLELAQMLDPDSDEAANEMAEVAALLQEMPQPDPPKEVASADFDVLVVGAGCAGVGTALMLTETFGLDQSRVVLMERGEEVGETFRRWPEEMRFISPSFNQQGWTKTFDLNSISKGTSPAFSIHTEHPSGKEYASYLSALAKTKELNIRTRTEVLAVRSVGTKELPLFSVDIRSGDAKTETLSSRYIVWAAGEFQYPRSTSAQPSDSVDAEEKKSEDEGKDQRSDGLPGSELCMHNSEVRSWAKLPGEDFIVIGGYESGVDATVHLSRAGKQCRVLASTSTWSVMTKDPSSELAPFTADRLRQVLEPNFSPKPKLFAPLRVVSVAQAADGGYNVTAEWKASEEATNAPLRDLVNNVPSQPQGAEGSTIVLHTPNPPILCTGFEGSVAAAAGHLFEFAEGDDDDEAEEEEPEEEGDKEDMEEANEEGDEEDMEVDDEAYEGDDNGGQKKGCLAGAPLLTEDDESTKVPGVFLVGPTVSHGSKSFCFVYKFRQRFAIVANAICEGLGIDTKMAIAECRKADMFLDDLSCCEDTCGDVC